LARQGVAARARKCVALVLEEATMNLVMHGFSGSGEHHAVVRVFLLPDTVQVSLVDDGMPFDPLAAPLPERPSTLAAAQPGGLGLPLMRRFSREMHYERLAGRNRLTLLLDRQ
jgi:serine/threonine-protein kinase RsbW